VRLDGVWALLSGLTMAVMPDEPRPGRITAIPATINNPAGITGAPCSPCFWLVGVFRAGESSGPPMASEPTRSLTRNAPKILPPPSTTHSVFPPPCRGRMKSADLTMSTQGNRYRGSVDKQLNCRRHFYDCAGERPTREPHKHQIRTDKGDRNRRRCLRYCRST